MKEQRFLPCKLNSQSIQEVLTDFEQENSTRKQIVFDIRAHLLRPISIQNYDENLILEFKRDELLIKDKQKTFEFPLRSDYFKTYSFNVLKNDPTDTKVSFYLDQTAFKNLTKILFALGCEYLSFYL